MLLEETRQIGERTYRIGHTGDYVKVAVEVEDAAARDAFRLNGFVSIPVRGFLTNEILV